MSSSRSHRGQLILPTADKAQRGISTSCVPSHVSARSQMATLQPADRSGSNAARRRDAPIGAFPSELSPGLPVQGVVIRFNPTAHKGLHVLASIHHTQSGLVVFLVPWRSHG